MSTRDADLEHARRVADAVLYEGYVLYPYRASARKNQVRWQFGVVIPRAQSEAGTEEPSTAQTECLLEAPAGASLSVTARFLQVQRREVGQRLDDGSWRPVTELDVDDRTLVEWDEGVEHEVAAGPFAVDDLLAGERAVPFDVPAARDVEEVVDARGQPAGRLVRTRAAATGTVRLGAHRVDAGHDLVRVRVAVDNRTDWAEPGAGREEVLRRSFVGLHTLLVADGGAFVSLLDPPEWARAAAAACENRNTYPVLVGERGGRRVVLSSPIILYDHPEVAPESTGDSFDATEIDELLSLMVSTLTDEEKRQARATDTRAAEVVDRADTMPAEVRDRLHGAIRYLQSATHGAAATPTTARDGAREDISEELADFLGVGEQPLERLVLGDVELAVGSRVRLRPNRRADAQDLFAEGRVARVARIVGDVDGDTYLAVTLEDDPGADLHEWYGRFLYYHPDEVELMADR